MDVVEILKKVVSDKALSSEERETLAEFRPQGVPQSRLDAEIARREKIETQNNELNKTLEELSSKISELENRDLSEQEKLEKNYSVEIKKLRDQVTTLTAEKDSSQKELEQIKFQQKVSRIAKEKQFNDPEYLGFLLKKAEIPIDAPDQIEDFVDDLKKSSPKLFKLDLRSGSGSNPGGHEMEFSVARESGDISAMLANAPEVIR
jgi:predicted RNase H-like nuclease (RuvC/YqgF family)